MAWFNQACSTIIAYYFDSLGQRLIKKTHPQTSPEIKKW
jgi:hypothetical protein